ncbi:hypothetical protein [Segetibacter koreensis]|uniref:hypothetical protein n=1 Tax=Segetibacter koreensis TaxID=398037 RepID=UPI000376E98C|nr:hypothetical protein [Segetibacter koreensis]
MINGSDQIFRITYEAFSKFSNNLNRCRTFEEIAECFTVNLKYLLNYHIFRATYCRNDINVHLVSITGKTTVTIDKQPGYLEYEKELLNEMVPKRWSDLSSFQLPGYFYSITDEQPELWGWNFANEDRKILISVLSGARKRFNQKDITFLKLVSDNLETKLLELCLIKELDEKNNIITAINRDQQKVIEERTREIAIKNKTLLEISVLNAHNVREPLSRILGLVNMLDDEETDELIKEVIPLLKTSANDLDLALQDVINHATKDLSKLKA